MLEPGPHPEETKRLLVLRDLAILDTLPEVDFDDLAQAAAALVDVPICLVSLVDEHRQWFKSRVGLDVSETPRLISFCGHAILEPNLSPLVVEDATQDPRFSDNPIVVGDPRVIFYVGVPIVVKGMPIGTLCVIDHQPRKISPEKMKILMGLARQVQRLIEFRNSCRDQILNVVSLRDAHALAISAKETAEAAKIRLQTTLAAIPDLLFEVGEDGRLYDYRAHRADLLAAPPEVFMGKKIDEVLPPAVSATCMAAIREAAEKGWSTGSVYSLALPQGEMWFELSVAAMPDITGGMGRRFILLARDVTARHRAEAALRASERHLRAIIETEPECVKLLGPNCTLMEMNPAGLRMIEANSIDEVIGQSVLGMILPEHRAAFAGLSERVQRGESGVLEFEIQGLKGTRRWLETRAVPLQDAASRGLSVLGITRDITAQKQAEAALRASEANLAITLNSIGDAVIATDPAGRITRMNPTAERLTGWTLAEATGRPLPEVFRIISAEMRTPCVNPAEIVLARGEVVGLANHTALLARDGQEYQIADSAAPIRDATGLIVGVVLVFSDVTEKYRVEELARERAMQLSLVIRGGDLGYWDWNVPTNKLVVNDRWLTMLGLDPEGHPASMDLWNSRVHPDDAHKLVRLVEEVILNPVGLGGEVEIRAHHTAGHCVWILDKFSVVERAADGSPLRVVGTHLDITARKRAESELRESEKRSDDEQKENAKRLLEINSALIQQKRALDQHALVSITDVHGTITYANEKFCDISGYAAGELVGKTHRVINSGCHSSDFFSALWRDIGAGLVWHGEIGNRKKSGELYWVKSTVVPLMTADGQPTSYIAISTDITASRESERVRRELEGQLLQAQKMEAIGTLAGGIAHDFNNILGIVSGNAEMLGTEAMLTPKQRNCQARIVAASDRAGDLVRQILNFSRKQDATREIVLFDRLIADALEFLRSSIPASTSMTGTFSAGDSRVRVDVTQIHQVVMNLVTNAWQALPGQQGLITVDTTIVDASEGILAQDTALPAGSYVQPAGSYVQPAGRHVQPAGRYVQLDVSDNGPGIPPELSDRIFEPFFTTKQPGKGTGLGLAVVHGVVRRHDGMIEVRNREGGGTIFRVLLPVVADPVSQSVPCRQPPVGGGKRVLVVDDEAALAELASMILTDVGYQVTTCGSPRTALTMLSGNDPGFEVLVMDLAMPGMTGCQLAEAVHARHPGLPIVLTTGFIDPTSEGELARLGLDGVLMKPWTMRSLAQAVHVALQKAALQNAALQKNEGATS